MRILMALMMMLAPFTIATAEEIADHLSTAPSPHARLPKSVSDGELLLIRAWNPKSGELVGWLPIHQVAMTMEQLGPPMARFDPNEAVTVFLPYRPKSRVKAGELCIAPSTATFQGRKWLPADRELNIVRIHNFLFYIKSIVFGDLKWRPPDSVNVTGRPR
jgi:hypothetical protein